MEPPFCSQFIRDTGVTHKLIARIKFFIDLKNETGKAGLMEERRIRERRRREEEERGRGEEEERMIGVEDGREEGWFLAMPVQEILIPAVEEEERWIGGV